MNILKEPTEYAAEVKALGVSKIEFAAELLKTSLDADYILACLQAW